MRARGLLWLVSFVLILQVGLFYLRIEKHKDNEIEEGKVGATNRKHQRTIKALLDAGYSHPDHFQIPEQGDSNSLVSTVVCSHTEAGCLLNNLFYLDGAFHLFIPGTKDPRGLKVKLSTSIQSEVTIQVHGFPAPSTYSLIPRFNKVTGIYSVTGRSLFEVLMVGAAFWLSILGNRLYSEQDFALFLYRSSRLENQHFDPLLVAYDVHHIESFQDLVFTRAMVGIPESFSEATLASAPQGVLEPDSLRHRALEQYTSLIRRELSDSLVQWSKKMDPGSKNFSVPGTRLGSDIHESAGSSDTQKVLILGDNKASLQNADLIAKKLRALDPPRKVTVLELSKPLNIYEELLLGLYYDVQVRIRSDLLGGVLLMRPGTTLIEIVPEKQKVGNHLACLSATLGVQYFLFDSTGPRLAGALPPTENLLKSFVLQMESKGGSKMFFEVEVGKIVDLIEFASNGKHKKYLTLMPWEQLNNQLIEFKAACATSFFLNRTLVLPLLGWRKVDTWNFNYEIKDFEWRPMERYYDQEHLKNLPCDFITMEEYKKFFQTYPGTMLFNPVAKATDKQQLIDYYCDLLKFPCEAEPVDIKRRQQISKKEIVDSFTLNDVSLFMGAMFWFYDFERYQPYPLVEYVNYMGNPLYAQIARAMRFSETIRNAVALATSRIPSKGGYNAMHVRRGDYYNKCVRIKDLTLRSKCYPSAEEMVAKMSEVFDPDLPVYISTNIGAEKKELAPIEDKFTVIFVFDIFKPEEMKTLDTTEGSFFDQLLCVQAERFIGNFYSSFSRSILELREAQGKNYDHF